ncbi:MAG: fatty acyl-AMP ligase [Ginsengibacter sp.]
MKQIPNSLVDILLWRAEHQPHSVVYRFLKDGEYDEACITYGELDRQARSIGATLQASTKAGERALLLLPAGLDFIAAYFGCLYANIIAIPVYPPHPARLEKSLSTIFRIASDSRPAAAIMDSSLYDALKSRTDLSAGFGSIKLIVADTDEIESQSGKWQRPAPNIIGIASLQYSSGSTSAPKGVIITHSNLLHNLGVIEESMGLTDKSETVFWLPPYHDMGLVVILQSLYTGYPATLMSHLTFLQSPIRWLQAITRFRATASGGPNFAYDMCVSKIRPKQREQLDLSKWEVAFNGAESINPKTLDQFANYFAPCGFRREAFFPCYGLAEATLMVVGGPKTRLPVVKNLLKSGLEENKVIITGQNGDITQALVSCGQNIGRQTIRILDVKALTPCLPNEVGEVCLSGPSVSIGYWNNPVENEYTFVTRLFENEEGTFLRTGDLGFLNGDELYITGRLKDLIIINGKNHYPHDIERTVEQSHSAILPGGCAVFSIDDSGSERLIVVAEIQHKPVMDLAEVIRVIRTSIAENHNLSVYDINLTVTGTIPRTTSGKIKHFQCKKNYLAETLNEIKLA